mmetsp:Transcript_24483/g.79912  ORF Transcript_24483/g.79912 Transcript_24483/m.79912 type:complete len:266 (+) Transcript_24483:484-1281(+)
MYISSSITTMSGGVEGGDAVISSIVGRSIKVAPLPKEGGGYEGPGVEEADEPCACHLDPDARPPDVHFARLDVGSALHGARPARHDHADVHAREREDEVEEAVAVVDGRVARAVLVLAILLVRLFGRHGVVLVLVDEKGARRASAERGVHHRPEREEHSGPHGKLVRGGAVVAREAVARLARGLADERREAEVDAVERDDGAREDGTLLRLRYEGENAEADKEDERGGDEEHVEPARTGARGVEPIKHDANPCEGEDVVADGERQ